MAKFTHGFLVFLTITRQGVSASEAFTAIQSSFSGFKLVSAMSFMDSQWAGLINDHMCKLLVKHAIEGD